MIEVTLLNYLKSKLSVPVVMEMPARPPAEIIILEKTGSSVRNYVNAATFVIQSYSDTLYHAAQLNESVKEAMEEAAELDAISAVELNSDYNFTDLQNKRYRYQAVYDIVY